jgi:hypothetical protein
MVRPNTVPQKVHSVRNRENPCLAVQMQAQLIVKESFDLSFYLPQFGLVTADDYEVVYVSDVELDPKDLFDKVIKLVKVDVGP